MKKFYTDSYTDKAKFVKDVVSAMVRQYGFAEARYKGKGDYESIEIIYYSDKYGVRVVKTIDVTNDSCISIMTDVLLNL